MTLKDWKEDIERMIEKYGEETPVEFEGEDMDMSYDEDEGVLKCYWY